MPIDGMQDKKNSISLKSVKNWAELRHPGLPSTGKLTSCDIKALVQEGLPGSGNVFFFCVAHKDGTDGRAGPKT